MKAPRKLNCAWVPMGFACAALACAAVAPAAAVADSAPPGPSGTEFVPGELLVQFEPGTSVRERTEIVTSEGAEIAERIPLVPRLTLVELPDHLGVSRTAAELAAVPEVRRVEPNVIFRAQATPNDQFFVAGYQWGLHNPGGPPISGTADADIDAPEAWDAGTGDPNIPVAIIDSGVDLSHSDLDENLWQNPLESVGLSGVDDDLNGKTDDVNGWDFIEDDPTPDDGSSHGTHVAGIAGAEGNNLIGVAGANWDAGLMALRAGRADGALPLDRIMLAIGYARDEGARVVNASFTGSSDPGGLLEAAIAAAPAVLFVTAAGNGGADGVGDNLDGIGADQQQIPCEFNQPNVICVGATTPLDTLAAFSNLGEAKVDLAAPGAARPGFAGTNILSTVPAYETVFSDDFEGAVKWTGGGAPNTWAITSELPFSGSRSLSDSPFVPISTVVPPPDPVQPKKKKGCKAKKTKRARKKCRRNKKRRAAKSQTYYLSGADNFSQLTTPVDLTGKDGCSLSFNTTYSLGSSDRVYVEGSSDGLPFTRLGEIKGSASGEEVIADLGTYSGKATFLLRFHLVTGVSSSGGDGIYVDDVRIKCLLPGGGGYGFKSGTSMATPYVAGTAALVLAAHPLYTVADLRTALLNNVDQLPSLACKVVTGGRLNADKAVDLGSATLPPPDTCP